MKYLLVIFSFVVIGQILFADPAPVCETRFKKNVVPTDCRYLNDPAGNPLWTRPQEAEWSRDVNGVRSGLVNIYVHGSFESLTKALKENGWIIAAVNKLTDSEKYLAFVGLDFNTHAAKDIFKKIKIFNSLLEKADRSIDKVILSMPVSNEYICGQMQVVAFEADNQVLKGRHHLRVFETGRMDQQNQPVWAIAANRDVGIKIDIKRPKQFYLNHKIEHDTDLERDTVAKALNEYGAQELPPFSYTLSCPPPRDGATSSDHHALEFYMN